MTIFFPYRSLRSKTPKRILICLSLTLLCLYFVFVVGVDQNDSSSGCIVVAILLHYLTLSTVTWMGVEAINLYLLIIKVYNAYVSHFMLKACLVAWGKWLGATTKCCTLHYQNDFHILHVLKGSDSIFLIYMCKSEKQPLECRHVRNTN